MKRETPNEADPDGAHLRYVETRHGIGLGALVRPGGRSPSFLFVHGLASNARLWDGVATRLAAAGFPSVAIDQRGHGLSQQVGDGFDFDTLTGDLADAIEAADLGPVVAVGQSWGGNVVVELAARFPHQVAAVAVIDGGFLRLADDFPKWESAREALAPPVTNGVRLEDMRRGMAARLEGFDAAAIEAQLANFRLTDAGTVQARLQRRNHFAILEQLWAHNPDAVASRIDAPVLVMAVDGGSPNKQARVAEFAAAAGATVLWMEGHHDIHAQQPGRVAESLIGWTATVLP